jgi:thiosulfate reductase cytochrome b subunit
MSLTLMAYWTSRAGLMIPLSRRADFPLGQPSPARNGWPWHATGISFFAWLFVLNGVAYVAYAISSGHLRRDMIPKMLELRNIGSSIVDHIKFKHPTGEAAKRYNVLQNLAYLAVIFGLLPLVVIAGWALSPRLDVVWTGWVDLLGGRQAARTLHFLAAMGLLVFVAIHVFEVIVSGLWNHMRSMVTGYYRVPQDKVPAKQGETP